MEGTRSERTDRDIVLRCVAEDVARNLPEEKVGDLVEAISAAPANN